MSNFIKILILFLLLQANCTLHAQEVNENVSAYFDDGGISKAKNIIKFNVFSTISGNPAFTYERLFHKRFAADASIGFLLPYFIAPIPHPFIDGFFGKREMGFSFALQAKLLFPEPLDHWYMSVKYSHNEFSMKEVSVRQQLITFHYGYQFFVQKRLNMEFAFGGGFRSNIITPDVITESTQRFTVLNLVFPLTFNIGYLF